MKIEFGYGFDTQTVEVPDVNVTDVLVSNIVNHELYGIDAIEYALDNPIGNSKLEEIVMIGQKIVIVTSDISRPTPSYEILPSIVKRINSAGIPDKDITIVFAIGSHRCHTEEEKIRLVGKELYSRIKCVDSDPNDCKRLGVTSKGTPIDITRIVAEADYRIAVGNIEFHYFAGYSGGVKAMMPGVSSPEAIQMNHRMMTSEKAYAGNMEENPVRDDIEEGGKICGVDYIINVVLDEHKHIVYAVAGDSIAAHRAGCAYLDKMYRKQIRARADIVLVSQGGAPKDANLYQTQKALENAKHAVKKGGTIIVIGECKEGLGNKTFEQWFSEADSPHAIVERARNEFQLGGHKAAAIAMVLEDAHVDLVSAMDDEYVKGLFLTPRHSAQEALDIAFKKYGPKATVIAMPYGGATLPYSLD